MLQRTLTPQQKKTLDFIKQYFDEHKKSPSLSEIATELDLRSKGTVTEHLSALEKKGFLKRISGAYRGIVLLEEEEGLVEMPLVELELYGKVAAGDFIEAIDEREVIKVPKRIIPFDNKQYFALEVKGESMREDGIYNGEIVIIEARDYANDGDLVVAQYNGAVTLKYFFKDSVSIRLEPRNSNMEEILIEDNFEDFQIIGVMRALTSRNAVVFSE